jgi:hypothetical protein
MITQVGIFIGIQTILQVDFSRLAQSNGGANVRNFLLIQIYVSNYTIVSPFWVAYIRHTKPKM